MFYYYYKTMQHITIFFVSLFSNNKPIFLQGEKQEALKVRKTLELSQNVY